MVCKVSYPEELVMRRFDTKGSTLLIFSTSLIPQQSDTLTTNVAV